MALITLIQVLYHGWTPAMLITKPISVSLSPSITDVTSSAPICGSMAPICLSNSRSPPSPVASRPGLTAHTLTLSSFSTRAHSRIIMFIPVLALLYALHPNSSFGQPFPGALSVNRSSFVCPCRVAVPLAMKMSLGSADFRSNGVKTEDTTCDPTVLTTHDLFHASRRLTFPKCSSRSKFAPVR